MDTIKPFKVNYDVISNDFGKIVVNGKETGVKNGETCKENDLSCSNGFINGNHNLDLPLMDDLST